MSTIRRLSASTNVVDCNPLIGKYLASLGHKDRRIGSAEVWTLRSGGRVVAAGSKAMIVELSKAMELSSRDVGGRSEEDQ